MDVIAGIAFLLSTISNGADLQLGVGMAKDQDQFINPIGIIELVTPMYNTKNWGLLIEATHLSSIPDWRDNNFDGCCGYNNYNPYESDLNMVSMKLRVKLY